MRFVQFLFFKHALEKILEEIEKRVDYRKALVRYEKKMGTITDVARNQGALEEIVIIAKIIDSSINDGWIPVEERLPEETDSTFKKFKDTNKWSNARWEQNSEEVNITYELEAGTRKSGTSYTIDGKWRCEKEDRLVKRKVIAWQPLPESYKPKKHEKEHKNTQQEMEDFWNNK